MHNKPHQNISIIEQIFKLAECWPIVFYSISTLVGYLKPNPVYTY